MHVMCCGTNPTFEYLISYPGDDADIALEWEHMLPHCLRKLSECIISWIACILHFAQFFVLLVVATSPTSGLLRVIVIQSVIHVCLLVVVSQNPWPRSGMVIRVLYLYSVRLIPPRVLLTSLFTGYQCTVVGC